MTEVITGTIVAVGHGAPMTLDIDGAEGVRTVTLTQKVLGDFIDSLGVVVDEWVGQHVSVEAPGND